MMVAVVLGVVACGDGSSNKLDEFATYWSDDSAWCPFLASCALITQDACLATWPTKSETEAAVMEAGIAADDVQRCETASRLLDTCALNASCAEYSAGACSVENMTFSTNCSLVTAAFDVYLTNHPRSGFTGPFTGTFDGDATGTFTGLVENNGALTLTIDSSVLGVVSGTGFVSAAGSLSFSASGTAMGSSFTLTFTGTLTGTATAFAGSGTWSSNGGTGSWSLQSGT
jgi:hypothetical protein